VRHRRRSTSAGRACAVSVRHRQGRQPRRGGGEGRVLTIAAAACHGEPWDAAGMQTDLFVRTVAVSRRHAAAASEWTPVALRVIPTRRLVPFVPNP
jgi:hypothetical protein